MYSVLAVYTKSHKLIHGLCPACTTNIASWILVGGGAFRMRRPTTVGTVPTELIGR